MAHMNIDSLCFQEISCVTYTNKLVDYFPYNDVYSNVGNILRELCLVRDNVLSTELKPVEIIEIINDLCVNR